MARKPWVMTPARKRYYASKRRVWVGSDDPSKKLTQPTITKALQAGKKSRPKKIGPRTKLTLQRTYELLQSRGMSFDPSTARYDLNWSSGVDRGTSYMVTMKSGKKKRMTAWQIHKILQR
jgi:hypothetical protein